jgi:hypothetical protein
MPLALNWFFRLDVSFDKSVRELFQRYCLWHLLGSIRLSLYEQHSLARLAPTLGRRS